MVEESTFTPLSPPTSPRMSGFPSGSGDIGWQEHEAKATDSTTIDSEKNMTMLHAEISSLPLDAQKRPILRNHKSFPYTLRQTGAPISETDSSAQESVSSTAPQAERITISNLEDVEASELSTATVTYGGSAPASPVSRLTPPSTSGEKTEGQEDSQGPDSAAGNTEEEEEQKPPLSAAELRAQKRKMKRFRLTHNQTRFLMSEFARQAHPDAAHRERLAREIPGLSPRQVQVWFQNRRAKLKRLTNDDRERMMRSRALPDDFDMTQALHSPFGATHNMGTPLASPRNYTPSFPEGNMVRPLSLDTLRRLPEGTHMSPTSITPALGGFTFTPPQSATGNFSPTTANPESSPFGFAGGPIEASPRRANPFAGSPSSAPAFTSHPQIPRLSLHDRIGRTRAESLSSPLRANMSYTSGGDGSLHNGADTSTHQIDGSQLSNETQLGSRNFSSSMSPYGLGYSYNPIPGFQASATTRMRSFSGSIPRRIELSINYSATRGTAAPQTATFPNYHGSPLSTPPAFDAPHMSAPHHITSFQNSYLRQDTSQTEPFPSVGAVLGEVEAHQDDNGSSGTSGLQMPQFTQGL